MVWEPAGPAALAAHERLHLLHAHDSDEWQLRSGRRRVVIDNKAGRVLANNLTMLRSLPRLGQGISVMDEVMEAADVKEGTLRRVLPQWTLPPMPSRY